MIDTKFSHLNSCDSGLLKGQCLEILFVQCFVLYYYINTVGVGLKYIIYYYYWTRVCLTFRKSMQIYYAQQFCPNFL